MCPTQVEFKRSGSILSDTEDKKEAHCKHEAVTKLTTHSTELHQLIAHKCSPAAWQGFGNSPGVGLRQQHGLGRLFRSSTDHVVLLLQYGTLPIKGGRPEYPRKNAESCPGANVDHKTAKPAIAQATKRHKSWLLRARMPCQALERGALPMYTTAVSYA
eukprot:1373193-Amphidinium_carterae.1